MSLAERRHPDWFGLNTRPDSVGLFARIAQNCLLDVPGEIDRRPGYRRLNQMQYDGPVWAIIDIQRICDFAKILVCSRLVWEHEEEYGEDTPGGHGGHGGGDIFINPNLAPLAVALGGPVAGVVPLAVQFNGAASFDPEGGALNYLWNFGDGNFSNLVNPLHIYNVPGVYNVTLTVTDPQGAQGVSMPIVINAIAAITYGTWGGVALGTSWKAGP